MSPWLLPMTVLKMPLSSGTTNLAVAGTGRVGSGAAGAGVVELKKNAGRGSNGIAAGIG